MAGVELTYFDGRGLGEVIRLVLTAAGIEFTAVDLTTREQFVALLPELPFKQVPLLRIDGMNLVQSGAIVRYIARKAKLLGTAEPDIVKIDMTYEATRDFLKPFMTIGFTYDFDKILETLQPVIDKYLPIFNKILKENGSGYLIGSVLSLADLGLFEVLLATVDYFGTDAFNDHPEIQNFYAKLSSLESMEKYRKDIRKPRNSPELAEIVKKILAW